MYSLRRTLAVRFSLTLFAALLLIALWAYLGARNILRDAMDRNLAAAAQLEAAAVASHLPVPIHHGTTDFDAFVSTVNRFVVVRDTNGVIVEANTPLASALPLDVGAFRTAMAGGQAWASGSWRTGDLRSHYVTAPPGSRPEYAVVQVAASVVPFEAASRQVLILMLGTVLLGTVAAAMGARWLAESTVAPVEVITRQAEGISSTHANPRITAHADVEEFAGLVNVLNGMLTRLQHAFEAQRRMIADTGHDLRTPLTAMRVELEIALRNERSPEQYRSILGSVLEEVDYLISISESLVLLARLEAGALKPEQRERDIVHLVERGAQLARSRAETRTVTVVSPETAVAPVDAKMFTVVIDQLLDNAVKHTSPDAVIQVTVASVLDAVEVRVEDGGSGMNEEERAKLFEHFYRTDEARTRSGTAGLGLTVVAAIVAAHGGTIAAETSSLGGLSIRFSIPASSQTS
jgi:two-component system OmpR family sensor kinase